MTTSPCIVQHVWRTMVKFEACKVIAASIYCHGWLLDQWSHQLPPSLILQFVENVTSQIVRVSYQILQKNELLCLLCTCIWVTTNKCTMNLKLHYKWYLVSPILIVLLDIIIARGIGSPTLHVNPTLSIILLWFLGGIMDLQCCDYYHLPSDIFIQISIIHDNISSQVVDKRR